MEIRNQEIKDKIKPLKAPKRNGLQAILSKYFYHVVGYPF